MNTLEDSLRQKPLQPRRELRPNFTQHVLAKIKNDDQANDKKTTLSGLRQRLPSHGWAVLLISITLLGSAAAAITLWPTPKVTPTIKKQLSSGNHIVGYDTENCDYFSSTDAGSVNATHEQVYYEVSQASGLTDLELQTSLQGLCEANLVTSGLARIEKLLPKDKTGLQSTIIYTITDISATSITVTPDTHYDLSQYTIKPNQTYTAFARNMLLYNQDTKIEYSDLRIGDSIAMFIKDTSERAADGHGNDSPLNYPESVTILAILKVPAPTTNPDAIYGHFGTDIVRVEPCTTSKTGFCRAYDFAPKP